MKRGTVLAAWLGTVVGVVPATGQTLEIGGSAPKLDGLTWLKGSPIEWAKVRGKGVTVVEFWATWCPPCIQSIPHLTELQHHYADKNLRIVGITEHADNNTQKNVEDLVHQWGDKMDYAVAFDKSGDVTRSYMAAAAQAYIPTAFVVDRNGVVAWIGPPDNTLDAALEKIISGTYDIKQAKALARIDKRIDEAAVLGDWEGVIKGMDEALAIEPDAVDRWWSKFQIYYHYLEKPQAAVEAAKQALAHARSDPAKLAEVAVQLITEQDIYGCNDLALKSLEKVRKTSPDVPEVHVGYFQALCTLGKTSQAKQVATAAIELMKSDGGKLNAFARLLSSPERRDSWCGMAMQSIEMAIRVEPDEPTHYLTKFNILNDCKNDPKAARIAGGRLIEKAAADVDLLNAFAWNLLTEASHEGKFNDLALAAAEKMVKAPGGDGWSQLETLALAKFATGAVDSAIALQKQAMAKCPNEMAKAALKDTLTRYEQARKQGG